MHLLKMRLIRSEINLIINSDLPVPRNLPVVQLKKLVCGEETTFVAIDYTFAVKNSCLRYSHTA
jgi:hypothetical protein